MADCVIVGRRATITALCAVCETMVSKPIPIERIAEFEVILDVTVKRHEATL